MSAKQKPRNRLVGPIALVSLAIFSVGIFAYGAVDFFAEMAREAGRVYGERVPVPALPEFGEVSFGAVAIATTTSSGVGWVPNIGVSEKIRFGTFGDNARDGFELRPFQQDCADATTTLFAIQNTTGVNVYIHDLVLKLTGAPTTTMTVAVGTGTNAFVETNFSDKPFTTLEDLGLASILGTVHIPSSTPTNTAYWASDYPGYNRETGIGYRMTGTAIAEGTMTCGDDTDQRDCVGHTRLNPGVFMHGFATVTPITGDNASTLSGVTSTGSIFDCSVYGHYYTLD